MQSLLITASLPRSLPPSLSRPFSSLTPNALRAARRCCPPSLFYFSLSLSACFSLPLPLSLCLFPTFTPSAAPQFSVIQAPFKINLSCENIISHKMNPTERFFFLLIWNNLFKLPNSEQQSNLNTEWTPEFGSVSLFFFSFFI